MKKELLTKLKHKQDMHRRQKEGQGTQEKYRDTVQVSKGWDQESQSPSGGESGEKCERQQEGLLHVHKQMKENEGKYWAAAEWCCSPAGKGHRKTKILNVLFASVFPGNTGLQE